MKIHTKIERIDKLENTHNGNPVFRIFFFDNNKLVDYTTERDAGFSYSIDYTLTGKRAIIEIKEDKIVNLTRL